MVFIFRFERVSKPFHFVYLEVLDLRLFDITDVLCCGLPSYHAFVVFVLHIVLGLSVWSRDELTPTPPEVGPSCGLWVLLRPAAAPPPPSPLFAPPPLRAKSPSKKRSQTQFFFTH